MRGSRLQGAVFLAAGWLAAAALRAQFAHEYASGPLDLDIPDGDLGGLVVSHEYADPAPAAIQSVAVRLVVRSVGAGGFTGDLYAALWHEGQRAVLVNRPGRTSANLFGYADSGDLDVTFTTGAARDIHLYRVELGQPDTPLAGPLTGLWAADSRAADPLEVTDTDPRVAGLEVFRRGDARGLWALMLVDASAGGTMQLASWSLTVLIVPEPSTAALLLLGLPLLLRRRRS